MASKTKVLVMVDWFDPAYKAGGPIRSCVHLVDQFHDIFDFYIYTSAYDLGDSRPMNDIDTGCWIDYRGKAKVWYATKKQLHFSSVRSIVSEVAPDYIYLNSFFSIYFSVVPLLIARLGFYNGKVILASRGMLKSSSLSYKPVKKFFFLQLFKLIGLHRNIIFQATDQQEVKDVHSLFKGVNVKFIPNLPVEILDHPFPIRKEQGSLRMIYMARIHPLKGLDVLLQLIAGVPGRITLTIAGAVDHASYWRNCQQMIKTLDKDKEVHFIGQKEHVHIRELLQQQHLFSLPSQGENFGHSIFESFAVGRPVLISDQTPWLGLNERKAGWDIPLSDLYHFSAALKEAVEWDQAAFDAYARGALRVAGEYLEQSNLHNEYKKLFS